MLDLNIYRAASELIKLYGGAIVLRLFFVVALVVVVYIVAGKAALATEYLKWGDPEITKETIPYGDCVSRVSSADKLNEVSSGWLGLLLKGEEGYTFTKQTDGLNINAQIIVREINNNDDTTKTTVTNLNCSPKMSYVEEAISKGELTAEGKAAKVRREKQQEKTREIIKELLIPDQATGPDQATDYDKKARQQMDRLNEILKDR